jgi:hypothetical protein
LRIVGGLQRDIAGNFEDFTFSSNERYGGYSSDQCKNQSTTEIAAKFESKKFVFGMLKYASFQLFIEKAISALCF